MENINNLALSALFDALTRNNLERELLLAGTDLNLKDLLDLKKAHSWNDFLKLYKNMERILGSEKAAREIAYTGIFNENLSTLRAIGTGFIDVKAAYWYMARVACRHLFRDHIKFTYRKLSSKQIVMEVSIAPELETCPLLLETYFYLFQNVPIAFGLPKANVRPEFSSHKGTYTISMERTTYFRYYFSRIGRAFKGYSSAVTMMEELESKSIQLTQLLNDKSELLRIMSHDISNGVTVIDFNVNAILKKGNLPEAERALLNRVKASAEHLNEILKNVQRLEVAQIRGVSLEPVNVELSMMAVKNNFQQSLDSKNIELIVENNLPAGIDVIAEKSSLELNVLGNLVSNAIKFSNPGSRIYLKTHLENDQAVLSVIDEGRGIKPEEMKNIFNKNIRTSTTGTLGEKGTGLGLGIVNYYSQLYQGHVTVESNFPKGTVFKIYLQAKVPHFLLTLSEGHMSSSDSLNMRN